MASNPSFAATVRHGVASVSTANTNRDGTGTIADILTAGASGSKIEEIVVKATGDPADCTVVIYIYDGSTYQVYDEWDIGNPAAGSTTVASYREARTYENLMLVSGEKLAASITVALTSGVLKVHAFGGDF
jgi:hypothetical protein